MKSSLLCSLALVGALSSAQGFTLDFMEFLQNDGDEFTITADDAGVFGVDGYGDLTFFPIPRADDDPTPPEDDAISLGRNFDDTVALEFSDGDSILVQFNAMDGVPAGVSDLTLAFVGGTGATVSNFDSTQDSIIKRIDWVGAPGGIQSFTFEATAIPEPSISLLGAIAGLALLRRRR